MRQLVFVIMHDGAQHYMFSAPETFDVPKWAESRRAAFTRLGVRGLRIETVEVR